MLASVVFSTSVEGESRRASQVVAVATHSQSRRQPGKLRVRNKWHITCARAYTYLVGRYGHVNFLSSDVYICVRVCVCGNREIRKRVSERNNPANQMPESPRLRPGPINKQAKWTTSHLSDSGANVSRDSRK